MTFSGKTYWLIGASEGLGEALSFKLDAEGTRLILSARSLEKLEKCARQLNHASVLSFDVTDPEAVRQACEVVGDVDGIVYLAGYYEPMNARDWRQDELRKMFEVNLFGACELLSHIAPKFAKRECGHIVLIGSLSAYRGLPAAIGYGASKAALLHIGENLMMDLKNCNVKVQVINPGFIATRLTDKNNFNMPQIQTSEVAADQVLRAMKSNRLVSAFPAPFKFLFTLSHFIPRRLFARLFG